MERLPSLRASDADREQVAERLRHATAEGRLDAQELEDRLEALFAARTYGELDALVADLPVSSSSSKPPVRLAPRAVAVAVMTIVVALITMSAVVRRHFAAAAVGSHVRRFRLPGPVLDPHAAVLATASMVAVFAVLLACAGLAWALIRSRASSNI